MSTTPPNLTELVMRRIVSWTGRRVKDLAIEIGAGLVVLRGRVNSYHVKQLAQHGAQEVLPNATLENAIIVD